MKARMLTEGKRVLDNQGRQWRVVHIERTPGGRVHLTLVSPTSGRGGAMVFDPGEDVPVPKGRPVGAGNTP